MLTGLERGAPTAGPFLARSAIRSHPDHKQAKGQGVSVTAERVGKGRLAGDRSAEIDRQRLRLGSQRTGEKKLGWRGNFATTCFR